MLLLLWILQAPSPDTLKIGALDHSPSPRAPIDSAHLGPPQLRLSTGQGGAMVWLLWAADTFFVAARIPDSTPYWGDDFVLSLDTRGDAAPSPQEDDFQWNLRRVLDSSVVSRGRNGRWQPPRADPDWRLGAARSGGGWEVSSSGDARGWCLLLRLDPAWLAGESGRLARVAIRIYDDSPAGWFVWPPTPGLRQPSALEERPELWAPAAVVPETQKARKSL